jgi:hypothetical protein
MGTILGVVIHVTAGEGDPFNEFANPANQVSSHFGILNGQGGTVDGALEQYVDTSLESWAQVAGNKNYISVETEGEPGDPLTPAQVATFGRLMAWLKSTHGIVLTITDTPGAKGLIAHGDGGAAWGGHTGCPGDLRKAQRAAILAAAGAGPIPLSTEEDLSMLAYDPDSGGFWATDADGDLANLNGAPFVEGLNQHPEYKAGNDESGGTQPCVGITAFKDKNGKHGICYATRVSGTTDVSGLRFYRFARDGSPD